jgi:hypothetical protein
MYFDDERAGEEAEEELRPVKEREESWFTAQMGSRKADKEGKDAPKAKYDGKDADERSTAARLRDFEEEVAKTQAKQRAKEQQRAKDEREREREKEREKERDRARNRARVERDMEEELSAVRDDDVGDGFVRAEVRQVAQWKGDVHARAKGPSHLRSPTRVAMDKVARHPSDTDRVFSLPAMLGSNFFAALSLEFICVTPTPLH